MRSERLQTKPIPGALVLDLVVSDTQLKPAWAMPIRNILRHSVFWHLGFWEWLGSAAIFVFLCAAVFLTPSRAIKMGCHFGES